MPLDTAGMLVQGVSAPGQTVSKVDALTERLLRVEAQCNETGNPQACAEMLSLQDQIAEAIRQEDAGPGGGFAATSSGGGMGGGGVQRSKRFDFARNPEFTRR